MNNFNYDADLNIYHRKSDDSSLYENLNKVKPYIKDEVKPVVSNESTTKVKARYPELKDILKNKIK